MNRLNSSQKDKVRQFQAFTSASEEISIQYLAKNSWNIENAADDFFANPPPEPQPEIDIKNIRAMFNNYADETGKIQAGGGLEKLMKDLGVEPDDIVMFIFAWQIKAANLGEFSKKEWEEGLQNLRIDSISTFRERLPALRAEIQDRDSFALFYKFLFDYALVKEQHQKTLDLAYAVELWKIVLKDRFVNLDKWCTFVTERYKKSISRDTWNQLLEFVRIINNDLNRYDPDGAWPVVIDEFVEYLKS